MMRSHKVHKGLSFLAGLLLMGNTVAWGQDVDLLQDKDDGVNRVETPYTTVTFHVVSYVNDGSHDVNFAGILVMKPSGTQLSFDARTNVVSDEAGVVRVNKNNNYVRLKYVDSYEDGKIYNEVTYRTINGLVVQTIVMHTPDDPAMAQVNLVDSLTKMKVTYFSKKVDLSKSSIKQCVYQRTSVDEARDSEPNRSFQDMSIIEKRDAYVEAVLVKGMEACAQELSIFPIHHLKAQSHTNYAQVQVKKLKKMGIFLERKYGVDMPVKKGPATLLKQAQVAHVCQIH